jgi:pre-mRNA-processing factor 39
MFQKHVEKHLPRNILSTDEFLAIRQEIVKAKDPTDVEATGEDSPPPGMEDEDAPPGEDEPAKESSKKLDAEDVEIRAKIIEKRQAVHKENEEEVSKRWTFEEGIKRPYFHVKPLERAQLKNWREYLDFEIENGSPERVMVLFERCMIACALYDEFWLKYAKYLESFTQDGTRSVYKRVCTIHLPTKVSVHMAWATYEEKLGNFAAASEILEQLEQKVTDYIPVMFHRINLERRRGNKDAAAQLFEGYIKTHAKSPLGVHFAVKYARFCLKFLGDNDKAVETLETLLETQPTNGKLYMQLVDVYYQQTPIKHTDIVRVLDRAIQAITDLDNKLLFAQRKVEFLEEFGSDMQMLQDAEEEHAKIFKSIQQEKKKRPPPDETQSYSEESRSAGGHSQKRGKREGREGTRIGYVEQSHNSRYQPAPVPTHPQPYGGASAQPAPVYPANSTQPPQQGYNYPAQNNWQNYQSGYGYTQPAAQTWPGYSQNYYGQS